MADNSPVAQMYIEATAGGSLEKLARQVQSFTSKQPKINLGLDLKEFESGAAKARSIFARIYKGGMSEFKTQISPFSFSELFDAKGSAKPLLNSIINDMRTSVPAFKAMGAQMWQAMEQGMLSAASGQMASHMASKMNAMRNVLRASGPEGQHQVKRERIALSGRAAGLSESSREVQSANAANLAEFARKVYQKELKETKDKDRALREARNAAHVRAFQTGNAESAGAMAQEAVSGILRQHQAEAKIAQERQAKKENPAYGPARPTTAQVVAGIRAQQKEIAAAAAGPARPTTAQLAAAVKVRAKENPAYGPALPSARQIASNLRVIERENSLGGSGVYGPARPTAANLAQAVREAERNAEAARLQAEEERMSVSRISQMRRAHEAQQRIPRNLKARVTREVDDANLAGPEAFAAAAELREQIEEQARQGFRRMAPGAERREARHAFRRDVQRVFEPYLDPMQEYDPESRQRRAQEAYKANVGSLTGQGPRSQQIRQSLEDARDMVTQQRDEARRQAGLHAEGTIGRRTQTQEANKFNQALHGINAALSREAELTARINALSERQYSGNWFGRARQRGDSAEIRRLENERKNLATSAGGKDSSSHGINFAMMNAAYGFQDFFQVLAQPGMGVSRAFLAAANNIGPALGVLAGSAVGANVAVGALLAGMAGLNMVMQKEDDQFKSVKEGIDRLTESYKKMHDARESIQMLSVSGSGDLAQLSAEFAKNLSRTPSTALPMHNAFGVATGAAERARTKELANRNPSYWSSVGSNLSEAFNRPGLGWSGFGIPFDVFRGAFGGIGGSDRKESPTDEQNRLFQGIGTYEQEVPDGPTGWSARGASRRRFNDSSRKVTSRMEALKESGYIDRYMKNLMAHRERESALEELDKSADQGVAGGMRGLQTAMDSGRSLGVSGSRSGYVSGVFGKREGFSSAKREAQERLDFLQLREEEGGTFKAKRDAKAALEASLGKAKPEDRADIRNQIQNLGNEIQAFDDEISEAKLAVKVFGKQAKVSGELLDALAGVAGGGRDIASLFMPGFDRGGLLGAQRRDEGQRVGVQEIQKRFGGMNPADKAFFELRSQALQFGETFADLMSKMQSIKTDFGAFKGLNFGNAARNGNAAISAGAEMGRAAGFDIETMPMAMQRVSMQAEILRKNLDELAMAEPGAANAIAKMKMSLEAIQLQKEQAAIANDPLMQSINAVNKYAIEIVNLNKSMAEGAVFAKQRGLTEKQGRMIKMEESLGKLGFNQSLDRQIGDFDQMVTELVKKMVAAGAPQADIDRVQAQAAQRRFDMFSGGPNEQARRGNQGGFVDNFKYGNNSGKMLNFNDRIRALQEKLQKDLMQPGLDGAGRANLQASHRKSVEREIAGMVSGMGTGKATIMDSGSVWQRIQESLSGNAVSRVEEQQLDVLRKIHDDLQAGKQPGGAGGGVFGGMLRPGNVKDNIQGQGGPVDGVILGGDIAVEQEKARIRGEKDAKDLAKKKKEADLADLESQLDEELLSIEMQQPGMGFEHAQAARERLAGEENSGDKDAPAWYRREADAAEEAGLAGKAERYRAKADAHERALKRKEEIEKGQVQGFGAMPQNVDGMAQAGMGGVSSQEMARQNALLERIATNSEKAIAESAKASDRLVEAIENSGLVIA